MGDDLVGMLLLGTLCFFALFNIVGEKEKALVCCRLTDFDGLRCLGIADIRKEAYAE